MRKEYLLIIVNEVMELNNIKNKSRKGKAEIKSKLPLINYNIRSSNNNKIQISRLNVNIVINLRFFILYEFNVNLDTEF